ncbi:flavodoxin domain-containing protein [Pseudooceanicola algae]|uniref:NADPH--hemoprotein reductase n=1 Tax=Pseudooceanicola algae TaxID=1537215 RepID=A0A418SJC6_9RHOB|nr:NADPH cytochrome P450 oxidoreductase family protein [Pseudooceanicola algae]QPM91843.1 hypothetical protein PSAL_031050 [Pseudooceanicola algae]
MIDALSPDPLRLGLAALIGLGWIAPTLTRKWRRGQAAAPRTTPDQPLVLFASQTGQTMALARQQAARLGTTALPLDAVTPECLSKTREAWFLLASAGDGEAPDNARTFAKALARSRPDLSGLRYGLLALGDRRYPSFCGFGRQIDGWLADHGARALFPRIDVDSLAPADLEKWEAALPVTACEPCLPPLSAPDLWHLRDREKLTPGQKEEAVYRLHLAPSGPAPDWTPGAIADVMLTAPDGSPRQRSYSVASLPDSGAVELILRRRQTGEGLLGIGSAWLTGGLPLGAALRMTLRDNPNLGALQAADQADRPLLLIATGTGLAAVLGPLRQRLGSRGTAPIWLIHGERHDVFAPLSELQDQSPPRLQIDAVLSRGGPAPCRLPDWLTARRDRLRDFTASGATVLICGSHAPGAAILAALETCLSEPGDSAPAEPCLDALRRQDRLLTEFY